MIIDQVSLWIRILALQFEAQDLLGLLRWIVLAKPYLASRIEEALARSADRKAGDTPRRAKAEALMRPVEADGHASRKRPGRRLSVPLHWLAPCDRLKFLASFHHGRPVADALCDVAGEDPTLGPALIDAMRGFGRTSGRPTGHAGRRRWAVIQGGRS